jgi:hypothetical protein
MFKTAWVLPIALCVTTASLALVAFRTSSDRSVFALVHWSVIALALVVSPFSVRELHSSTSVDAKAARARLVRVSLLIYLPLSSALSLLAFRGQ